MNPPYKGLILRERGETLLLVEAVSRGLVDQLRRGEEKARGQDAQPEGREEAEHVVSSSSGLD